ncbi:MAG TPA: hypothetical protein VN622_07825 [Clostridia bacterium]|nr:hypothetical protein [Clostridia bacterium]
MQRLKSVAALGLLLGTAIAMLAASAHFIRVESGLSGANVVITFKEAGLGDDETILYQGSAIATATYQCFTKSGNTPEAANKTGPGTVQSPPTPFNSGKNGSIVGSVTLSPPGPDFSCPSGQRQRLVCATYTDISIKDLTTPLGPVSATPSTQSTGLLVPNGTCLP